MTTNSKQLTLKLERSRQRIESARTRLSERTIAYLEGTLNELAVDRQCMDLSPVWARFEKTIPRFTRLPAKLQDHPTLTDIIFRTVNRLWRLLLPCIVIVQTMRLAMRKLRATKFEVQSVENVVFANSPRALDVLADYSVDNAVWTAHAGGSLTANRRSVQLLALVTWKEVFGAAFESLSLNRKAAACLPDHSDRIQFYTALPCLLTWTGLERLLADTKTVCWSNHYDRWGVLIDRLPIKAERTLIQHGMLYADRSIPTKLKNTDIIHVFDEESEQVFRTVIVSNANTKYIRSKYTLNLTKFERRTTSERLVLLVGNLLHAEDEDRLIETCLNLAPSIRVLVKPHPRIEQARYERHRGERVDIVQGAKTFPDADLVLSPESTLGKEYEATDIPVLWYTRLSNDELQSQILVSIESPGKEFNEEPFKKHAA